MSMLSSIRARTSLPLLCVLCGIYPMIAGAGQIIDNLVGQERFPDKGTHMKEALEDPKLQVVYMCSDIRLGNPGGPADSGDWAQSVVILADTLILDSEASVRRVSRTGTTQGPFVIFANRLRIGESGIFCVSGERCYWPGGLEIITINPPEFDPSIAQPAGSTLKKMSVLTRGVVSGSTFATHEGWNRPMFYDAMLRYPQVVWDESPGLQSHGPRPQLDTEFQGRIPVALKSDETVTLRSFPSKGGPASGDMCYVMQSWCRGALLFESAGLNDRVVCRQIRIGHTLADLARSVDDAAISHWKALLADAYRREAASVVSSGDLGAIWDACDRLKATFGSGGWFKGYDSSATDQEVADARSLYDKALPESMFATIEVPSSGGQTRPVAVLARPRESTIVLLPSRVALSDMNDEKGNFRAYMSPVSGTPDVVSIGFGAVLQIADKDRRDIENSAWAKRARIADNWWDYVAAELTPNLGNAGKSSTIAASGRDAAVTLSIDAAKLSSIRQLLCSRQGIPAVLGLKLNGGAVIGRDISCPLSLCLNSGSRVVSMDGLLTNTASRTASIVDGLVVDKVWRPIPPVALGPGETKPWASLGAGLDTNDTVAIPCDGQYDLIAPDAVSSCFRTWPGDSAVRSVCIYNRILSDKGDWLPIEVDVKMRVKVAGEVGSGIEYGPFAMRCGSTVDATKCIRVLASGADASMYFTGAIHYRSKGSDSDERIVPFSTANVPLDDEVLTDEVIFPP